LGLLWVGGPQVDPNYEGPLSCPIYNLSDKEIRLQKGDRLATIDFIKTTPIVTEETKQYPYKSKNNPIRVTGTAYSKFPAALSLKSGLFNLSTDKIEKMGKDIGLFKKGMDNKINDFDEHSKLIDDKIDDNRKRIDQFVWGIFTVIALLITALSIMVSTAGGNDNVAPYWVYISFIPSALGIILSVWALTIVRNFFKTKPENISRIYLLSDSYILPVLLVISLIMSLILLLIMMFALYWC